MYNPGLSGEPTSTTAVGIQPGNVVAQGTSEETPEN